MIKMLSSFFKSRHSAKNEIDQMKKYLIVGLGNIGDEYAETRHNVGFKALDTLAQKQNFSFETKKLGSLGNFNIKGRKIICLKPATYMNLSGKALKYWMGKENIPLENVLVITDDINLPFGTIRIKGKGSDGGHNGLKNIQESLNTSQYHRLRVGVGSAFGKGKQVDYVLGSWNEEELKILPERLEKIAESVLSFALAGPKETMNKFNNT